MDNETQYPDWDLKDRDRHLLSELANDPTLSAAELRDILEEKYDIDVSRVTVSESVRQMREAAVFKETIIPNEEYLFFSLFEYQFFPPNFSEGWRDALEYIQSDKHTLFFFLADGQYQWKSIMIFRDIEQQSRWIHEFYNTHGNLILDLKNTVVTNMLKFGADPEVFQTLLND